MSTVSKVSPAVSQVSSHIRFIRAAWVVAIGWISTAITLALVYLLNVFANINPVGWFYYSIPVGAFCVGIAAGSGYGLGAKWLGVKINKWLAWTILAMSLFAYFAADYTEFRAIGPLEDSTTHQPIGYWDYFHAKAMNWRLHHTLDLTHHGVPLGALGYFFVIAGILGFAGASLLVPWWISSDPYCPTCERFLRNRLLALWPADLQVPGTQGGAPAYETAQERLYRLVNAARTDDMTTFADLSRQTPAARQKASSQLRRFCCNLWQCPDCSAGYLQGVWLSGRGRYRKSVPTEKFELRFQTIRSIMQRLEG
jgi:hypothetical protein